MKPRAIRLFLLLLGLAFATYAAFVLTPWPAALLLRAAVAYEASRTEAALARHVPAGVRAKRDIAYGSGEDEKLDIYLPAQETAAGRPTVVWIHGGAFVGGSRQDIAPYLQILAGKGFPAVALGFSRAPGARYPVPVLQANAALGFLRREGGRLGLDPDRIVLAGETTGAHVAAQLAAALTAPDYAGLLGLRPALPAPSLKGAVLFGGAYDMTAATFIGPFGSLVRSVLFAYFGTPNPFDSPAITEASVTRYLTDAFPPSFVSAGDGDPLLAQSTLLARALRDHGVVVDALFFPPERTAPAGRGYQFDLDKPDGRLALERLTAFLAGRGD